MDPVAFPEDEGTHLGVPTPRLVPEVNASFEEFVESDFVHVVMLYRLLNWKRFRAFGRPGFLRSTFRASRVSMPCSRSGLRRSSS